MAYFSFLKSRPTNSVVGQPLLSKILFHIFKVFFLHISYFSKSTGNLELGVSLKKGVWISLYFFKEQIKMAKKKKIYLLLNNCVMIHFTNHKAVFTCIMYLLSYKLSKVGRYNNTHLVD